MSGVLVLNAGYEPLHRVSIRHAIRMLVREVAVIEEAAEGEMFGEFPKPLVLRLVRYVAAKWKHNMKPRWSKSRLLARDQHKCAYCGGKATTVDHILPSSRGGKTTWDNTVAACVFCNNCKDDKTPEEVRPCSNKNHRACRTGSGMRLRATPYTPTWWEVTPS